MNVHLLVTTNGRDELLTRTLDIALGVDGKPGRLCGIDGMALMVDDTGSAEHRSMLGGWYPGFEILAPHPGRPAGQPAAIETAWSYLRANAEIGDYIFHLEDDFILGCDVDARTMARLVATDHRLAQVVLMRQPWYANEIAAGGVIQARQEQGAMFAREDLLTVHRDHWSFNPCAYSVELVMRNLYPQQHWAESAFGQKLAEHGWLFAYLGRPEDWPSVMHTGTYRVGVEY